MGSKVLYGHSHDAISLEFTPIQPLSRIANRLYKIRSKKLSKSDTDTKYDVAITRQIISLHYRSTDFRSIHTMSDYANHY